MIARARPLSGEMSSRHELSNGEEAQAQEAKVEKEGVLFLRASPVGHEVKWSHPYAKIIPGYMYLFQKPVVSHVVNCPCMHLGLHKNHNWFPPG